MGTPYSPSQGTSWMDRIEHGKEHGVNRCMKCNNKFDQPHFYDGDNEGMFRMMSIATHLIDTILLAKQAYREKIEPCGIPSAKRMCPICRVNFYIQVSAYFMPYKRSK